MQKFEINPNSLKKLKNIFNLKKKRKKNFTMFGNKYLK